MSERRVIDFLDSDFLLAEKCYLLHCIESELYDKVDTILNEALLQCWWDNYDYSIEIITERPITREEADRILALGFGQIFESPAGINWTKNNKKNCSRRVEHALSAEDHTKLLRKMNEDNRQIEEIKKILKINQPSKN